MLVYGVVSEKTEEAFELLPTLEQAEAFIANVANCMNVVLLWYVMF